MINLLLGGGGYEGHLLKILFLSVSVIGYYLLAQPAQALYYSNTTTTLLDMHAYVKYNGVYKLN